MWFVLIVHYDGDEDDDDDDRPYGDEGYHDIIGDDTARPLTNVVRLDEDDHLIKALLIVHHFIMASLAKSLQGFQMWFVLVIMVFVMMMMNYSGEDVDPSLLVHDND